MNATLPSWRDDDVGPQLTPVQVEHHVGEQSEIARGRLARTRTVMLGALFADRCGSRDVPLAQDNAGVPAVGSLPANQVRTAFRSTTSRAQSHHARRRYVDPLDAVAIPRSEQHFHARRHG